MFWVECLTTVFRRIACLTIRADSTIVISTLGIAAGYHILDALMVYLFSYRLSLVNQSTIIQSKRVSAEHLAYQILGTHELE